MQGQDDAASGVDELDAPPAHDRAAPDRAAPEQSEERSDKRSDGRTDQAHRAF